MSCPEVSTTNTFASSLASPLRRLVANRRSWLRDIPPDPHAVLFPNRAVLRQLFMKLDARTAHEGMVRTLKRTRNLLKLSDLVAQLPTSLHTAALSVPLRKLDHVRLVNAVNARLSNAMAWA
jgi:hypothetical protein